MANEYTTEELDKIVQLRKRFSVTSELREDQSTDHFLIKWLRARGLDVNKAEQMLRKSLEWRKENRIDSILETMKVPENIFRSLPVAYLGIDPTTGCPVLLYLMGRYDMRAHLEEVGAEELLMYNIYIMEYVHKVIFKECTVKAGRPIDQIIELIDLEGYSYRQLANSQCRDAMMRMQVMFDSNYPEVLHRVAMVNAPKVFSIIYNLVKPLVAKATLDKIAIYGTKNWQHEIRNKCPMEIMPAHYGGSRPGVDEFCSGDPIWLFGLDKDFFKDLEILKVKPRDKVHLDFEVSEEGSCIIWKFKSEGHDICFGILHDEDEVLPIRRVDSHKEIQTGELSCQRLGKYTIVFDNTYSYTKGKSIHHRIEVISSFDNVTIN